MYIVLIVDSWVVLTVLEIGCPFHSRFTMYIPYRIFYISGKKKEDITESMSFIKIKKSISPRIKSWGTPDKTSYNLKFNTTFCLQSHYHSPIQAATLPLIP